MSYTIEEFTELFGISRAYYYELQAKGDGPLITWAGPGKPRIKLKDALAWAEQRIERVALKHRARYEAGILHIKADEVIIANVAAMLDAEERAKQRRVEKEQAAQARGTMDERLRQRGLVPIPDIYERRMKQPVDAVLLPMLVMPSR